MPFVGQRHVFKLQSWINMNITYYRKRRSGLETAMEDAIAAHADVLFRTGRGHCWIAGSLPIGAGMPDLTIVRYNPQIVVASEFGAREVDILAYLRAIPRARADTIARRTGQSAGSVERALSQLCSARVIRRYGNVFALTRAWRNVLSDIVTIEAKVHKWQSAINQAMRNAIFCHRSYVALPARAANRASGEPVLRTLGIGILAVDGRRVTELRRPRRQRPQVWTYYYRIAVALARQCSGR
jgi:hypothetical protein